MELKIYNLESKIDKRENPYWLLDTDLGNVYCFSSDFEGDFNAVGNLAGMKIDGGITAGDFPKLRKVEGIIGSAGEKPKKKDRDRIISRIACVNSSVKMSEVIGITDKKEVFNLAEEIFSFISE